MRSDILSITLGIVRTLRVLNIVAALAFAALLVAAFFEPGLLNDPLIRKYGPETGQQILIGIRGVLALGMAAAVPVHILFDRILRMVRSVRRHRAFEPANARHLRVIAWMILAIQLLDLAFGALSMRIDAMGGDWVGWSPSLTGWLAVFLIFVLARVFDEGAAMQDDLDGTV